MSIKPQRKTNPGARRVAISLEMDWGYKRHLELYAGCQQYADEAGWKCFINPAIDRELNAAKTQYAAPPFDGVLARVSKPLARAAGESGIPIVNVWVNSPAKNIPSALPDGQAAGVMAAEHLLGRGFRRFGFLGYARDIQSHRQMQGFQKRIRAEGLPCSIRRCSRVGVEGKAPGWKTFETNLRDWIDSWKPPIGILVTQDLISRYLINLCQAKGLIVSQQVAIVGLGNESPICEAPPPTLTSIDEAYAEVGYRAAALLDRLMDGEPPPRDPEMIPPAGLIPRQSTDSFAAGDPMVEQTLRFIAENSHTPLKVNDVARAMAINRRTLERRFRDSIGRGLAEEITRFRLERAKRRMVETDEPLKSVAQDCGFLSSNQFYKTFLRVERVTPTQYRNDRRLKS